MAGRRWMGVAGRRWKLEGVFEGGVEGDWEIMCRCVIQRIIPKRCKDTLCTTEFCKWDGFIGTMRILDSYGCSPYNISMDFHDLQGSTQRLQAFNSRS